MKFKLSKRFKLADERTLDSPFYPGWRFTIRRPDEEWKARGRARLQASEKFSKYIDAQVASELVSEGSVSRKLPDDVREQQKAAIKERRLNKALEGFTLGAEGFGDLFVDREGAALLVVRVEGVQATDDEGNKAAPDDPQLIRDLLAIDNGATSEQYIDGEGEDALKIEAGAELGLAHTLWILREANALDRWREEQTRALAGN